jgi:hypothetical protein
MSQEEKFDSNLPMNFLTDSQRARLAVFADLMISGGSGMPSASEIDVQGKWIDRVFSVREDLISVVLEVIEQIGEPKKILAAIRVTKPNLFSEFGYTVAGAYFLHPKVRKELGYPGRLPVSRPALVDEAESYLEDGILDPVIARGPIYRPTPQ